MPSRLQGPPAPRVSLPADRGLPLPPPPPPPRQAQISSEKRKRKLQLELPVVWQGFSSLAQCTVRLRLAAARPPCRGGGHPPGSGLGPWPRQGRAGGPLPLPASPPPAGAAAAAAAATVPIWIQLELSCHGPRACKSPSWSAHWHQSRSVGFHWPGKSRLSPACSESDSVTSHRDRATVTGPGGRHGGTGTPGGRVNHDPSPTWHVGVKQFILCLVAFFPGLFASTVHGRPGCRGLNGLYVFQLAGAPTPSLITRRMTLASS